MKVFERLVEPERQIIFRVPWLNDKGEVQVNLAAHLDLQGSRWLGGLIKGRIGRLLWRGCR
jgi:glutamate dehydrogenase/leucine dehydrogenase